MRQRIADFLGRSRSWISTHKKYAAVIALLLLALIGGAVYWLFFRSGGAINRIDSSSEVEEVQLPKIVPSPLTGLDVTEDLAKRPVIGVMIENSQAARPQSGLVEAGVVFEAIAEGGITRFLALYQEDQPENIGPVRSLRPYYIDWVTQFDAAVAHVGGSPDALSKAKSVLGNKDLDQFRYGTRAFDRVKFRSAPHNVYTSMERLYAIATGAGHTSSTFTSLPRKLESPSATPDAVKITVNFSSKTFQVIWRYDADKNRYVRSNAGVVQTDRDSGLKVKADVIVVLKTNYRNTGFSGRQDVTTVGSGEAWIFQDGTVTPGSWHKSSANAQFVFKDSAGTEVSLNAGRTWFEIIPVSQSVTYQ